MAQRPTIDGFRPRKPSVKSTAPPVKIYSPTINQPKNKSNSKELKHRLPSKRTLIGFLALILPVFISALLGAQIIAEVIIIVSGVVAIVRNVSSRIVFSLAVVTLSFVFVLQLFDQALLAGAFASYTFLLLAFGTVCLSRELSKV